MSKEKDVAEILDEILDDSFLNILIQLMDFNREEQLEKER